VPSGKKGYNFPAGGGKKKKLGGGRRRKDERRGEITRRGSGKQGWGKKSGNPRKEARKHDSVLFN